MKRILIVSDLHVGSKYGIMPEEVVVEDNLTGDMIEYFPNPSQRKLLNLWNEMLDDVGEVDGCIVNGDTCDGMQYSERGKSLWTPDLTVQAEAAADLLKRIETKKFWFTLGSGYHTTEDRPLDEAVARRVGGIFYQHYVHKFKEERVRVHVAHVVGTSRVFHYRTTPLARDMLLMHLNKDMDRYGKLQGVIRSHAHYVLTVGYSTQQGIITPGWQLMTPFGVKKGLWTPPDVGYVLMTVNDGSIDFDVHSSGVQKPCPEVVI